MLDELKDYLDRNDLLPSWKNLLDVVNCASTLHEVATGAYMCPDIRRQLDDTDKLLAKAVEDSQI